MIFTIVLSLASCGSTLGEDTIGFEKKNTMVIAHRGLSGLEVENTEAAFIAAGQRSYYGIEADVRRTADGKFVICHDDNLKRISGEDISVEESTLSELMGVDLLDRQGVKSDSTHLTALDRYISICKEYDKQAILELKSSFTKEEIAQIVDIIKDMDYINRVTFISFDYDNLLFVRELSPEQSVQYLFSKYTPEIKDRLIRDRIDVAIKHTALSKRLLDDFHSAGLKVNCWTVDNKFIAEQLAGLGVDFITTNILE